MTTHTWKIYQGNQVNDDVLCAVCGDVYTSEEDDKKDCEAQVKINNTHKFIKCNNWDGWKCSICGWDCPVIEFPPFCPKTCDDVIIQDIIE